jgi:2,3,4,5-tetrahydropyridine-2-carboxylate N-succinyltransferase
MIGEHKQLIEEAWDNRDLLTREDVQTLIRETIDQLDKGEIRVAEPDGKGSWKVNQWVKKAVILYFPIQKMETIEADPFEFHDKIPLKKNYPGGNVRPITGYRMWY